ncbi:TrmB family transcriptional regulator [archaeon]|jgi:HTH-type transcriptional regulator, sugar sensing transcriptional regulator|nr:TrmB family transcriptional regulator [archaeon]
MILETSFLKKLKSSFSLNEYEVKVWAALLSKGVATAGEISDISEVPRSRTYDVLEALEKRGFIIMKVGKPINYIAVDPKEVLARIKKEIKTNANNRIESINKINSTEIFTEINNLYKTGIDHVDPTTITGAVRGRKNLYNQIEEMIGNAKTSIVISTTEQGLIRKLDSFGHILKKKSKNGVSVKIVSPSKINDEEINKFTQSIKSDKDNGRFILVDNEQLLFMLTDEDTHEQSDTGIWVKSPFFVNTMSKLVNSLK